MSVGIAVVQQETVTGEVVSNRERAPGFAREAESRKERRETKDTKKDERHESEEVMVARDRDPWLAGQRRDLYC